MASACATPQPVLRPVLNINLPSVCEQGQPWVAGVDSTARLFSPFPLPETGSILCQVLVTPFPGHVRRVMIFAVGLVAVFTLLILRSNLSTFRTLLNHRNLALPL